MMNNDDRELTSMVHRQRSSKFHLHLYKIDYIPNLFQTTLIQIRTVDLIRPLNIDVSVLLNINQDEGKDNCSPYPSSYSQTEG